MTKQKDRHNDSTDTITIRVPALLKQRIISLSKKRDMAVNEWMGITLARITRPKSNHNKSSDTI